MKNFKTLLAAVALSVCQIGHAGDYHPQRVLLVAPAEAQQRPEVQALVRGYRAELHRLGCSQVGVCATIIRVDPGTKLSILVDELRRAGLAAELDQRVSADELTPKTPAVTVSDPDFGRAWYLAKIGASTAWASANGSGVVVAVLDTGVDGTHPDLAANMVPGWNAYDNNADTRDVFGHGTKVAGVVAAVANNGRGAAGYAWGSKVMPIRISDTRGYTYWSTVAQGIMWAADHGARVANVSFNGLAGSVTVQTAAQYMRDRGGVVVVAAGNSGKTELIADSAVITAVAATDGNDVLAGFSSRGPYVDVCAPGTSMYTTARGGGYDSPSGTSFAAPLIAGVYAATISAHPALSPAEADAIMFASVWKPSDSRCGHGRVRGWMAVQNAAAVAAQSVKRVLLSIECPATQVAACVAP